MSYELVIVSKVSESDGLLSRVEKALKDAEATEVKIEKLGKKLLAFPIKKQTEADYIMINFEAEGKAISDISQLLRLEQEALLRHLLIKQKVRKAPRRRILAKKEVEEKKVEKPKVTVVTKQVTKDQAHKETKNVDVKAKSKVASKAKPKSKGKSKK